MMYLLGFAWKEFNRPLDGLVIFSDSDFMMISGWFLWDNWVIAVEVIVAAFFGGIEDGEFQHSVDQSKCNPLAYQLLVINLILLVLSREWMGLGEWDYHW